MINEWDRELIAKLGRILQAADKEARRFYVEEEYCSEGRYQAYRSQCYEQCWEPFHKIVGQIELEVPHDKGGNGFEADLTAMYQAYVKAVPLEDSMPEWLTRALKEDTTDV